MCKESDIMSCALVEACGPQVALLSNLPDSSLSASNQLDSVARSRLHTTSGATGTLPGAWNVDVITGEDIWIQADLVYEMTLEKVATQGQPDVDEWVMTYSLRVGMEEASLNDVIDASGSVRVFLLTTLIGRRSWRIGFKVFVRGSFVCRYSRGTVAALRILRML